MTNSNKLADALDCFRSPMLDAALSFHNSQVSAIAYSIAAGVDAVAKKLREHDAQPAPDSPEVIDAVRDVMHEVFKYADIAAPLRGPPMTQEESAPVRKAAAGQDKVIRNMLYALAAPQPAPAPVQVDELSEVARVIDEGGGFWRPCSGCYETSDGCNVNGFPFSEAFRCDQGGGCDECGGIGVVWDNLDYAAADDNAHPPAPAADGAGELPPLPNPWQCETRICPALFTGEQMRNYVIAAIAALRQPVPDAVRDQVSDAALAQAFREATAQSVGAHDAMVYARARELESALASQQESRNG
jgi:hypothetical protein